MGKVFAISKAGIDVFDALATNDPNDFIIHSDYSTFKILASGKLLNQTVSGEPTTFSVAHGLGYTPNFFSFCKFPDGKVAMNGQFSYDFTGHSPTAAGYGYFLAEADDTYLYFLVYKNSGASNFNVNIKYFIFEVAL